MVSKAQIWEAMPSNGGLRRRRRSARRKIYVKKLNGDTVALEMDPMETIGAVKAMIEDEAIHPGQEHLVKLVFQGEVLDDDRTLADYNIQADSVLIYWPQSPPTPPTPPSPPTQMTSTEAHRREGMPLRHDDNKNVVLRHHRRRRRPAGETKIFVRTSKDSEITLRLKLSETIAGVKAMIQKEKGISPENQCLLFNEWQLDDDDRTLADCSIQHGSTLVVLLRLGGRKPNQMESTKSHQRVAMAMAPNQRPKDFSDADDFSDIEVDDDDSKIIVKNFWGSNFELKVMDLSETIHDFKYRLYDKAGVYPTFQSLRFEGKQLEDGCTLANYNIKKGSILHLGRRLIRCRRSDMTEVPIKKLNGETITLPVLPSGDIAYIRIMLYISEGIPLKEQHLEFDGKPLCDGRTLADYNIQDNSTLHLAPGRGILSPPKMESTEARHREAMAMALDQRPVAFAVAGNDDETYISVQHLTGKIDRVQVTDLSETIGELKWWLFFETGMPVSQQRIFFAGEMLEDGRTLADYNIQKGSKVHLVLRLRGGGGGGGGGIDIVIKGPDGEFPCFLGVSLSLRISDVMLMLRDGHEIPPEQHLEFEGRPLEDGRTLADYNIPLHSTLHLASAGCAHVNVDIPPSTDESEDKIESEQEYGHYEDESDDTRSSVAAVDKTDDQLSFGAQDSVVGHEGGKKEGASGERKEPQTKIVHNIGNLADELKKQQKRYKKYSVKALIFAISIFAAFMSSASTSSSAAKMAFKSAIGTFFITDALLAPMMPRKWGNALVYLSCFLLMLVSYMLLVSFDRRYGYAILPVLLPIVAAFLQQRIQKGRTNNEADQNVNNENGDDPDHSTDDEDGQHFDHIFESSCEIVNSGGLITVVFGNSMVGKASALGFFFFYTIALGLYLMMVTAVRNEVLTPHARFLAIMMKFLLMITLMAGLIHGVRH